MHAWTKLARRKRLATKGSQVAMAQKKKIIIIPESMIHSNLLSRWYDTNCQARLWYLCSVSKKNGKIAVYTSLGELFFVS